MMNAEILLSKFLSQLNNPDQNKELELFDYLFSISSKIKREHRNPVQGCVSYLREIIQMLENNEIQNLNNNLINQLQNSLSNNSNPILVLHILELVYLCKNLKVELFSITQEQFKQLLMTNKNDGKILSLILLLNCNENWILKDLIQILLSFIQINHIDLRVLINALITVIHQSQSIDFNLIITHCEVILNYCQTMDYDEEILKIFQIIHKYSDIFLEHQYFQNYLENQMSDLSLLPQKFQIWKQASQIVYENEKLLISSKSYILIALHTSQPHFDISITLFIRFVEIQELNPKIQDKYYVGRITLYLEELMNPKSIGQLDHTNWISIYNCLTALLLYTNYNVKSYIITDLVYVSDDRELQLSLFIYIRILNHLHPNLIDFNSLELRNHIAKWSLSDGDVGDIAHSLLEIWIESQN